jgi:hypothetical protein
MVESAKELPITRDVRRPSRAGDVGARAQTDTAIGPLIAFVVCALGLSWLAFLPLILGGVHPESTAGSVLLPLVGIGAPTFTAFVMLGLGPGKDEAGRLWRAGLRWRVRARWYALVLILPGLA